MAYTDNKGSRFNTFDSDLFKKGKKISHNKYDGATVNDLKDIASENDGKSPTIVNAVEIDWNGAKPGIGEGNNGITTTGELIKDVYSPMFAKAA